MDMDGQLTPRRLARSDAPGSRDREYWVHAPRRRLWRRLVRRPALLMVLHGCKQTGVDMIRATRFAEEARARDYVVVFPSVTSWRPVPYRASNCWGFWIPEERRRGEGEAGDLRRLLASVEAEFGCDPRRRYVTGLSSGGAMAVALAVAYPDAIRAVGSVAGLAYGETSAAVSTPKPFVSLVPWFLEDVAARSMAATSPLPRLLREMEAAHDPDHDPVPLQIAQSTRDRVVRLDNAKLLRDVWYAMSGGAGSLAERCGPLESWPGERCRYVDAKGRTHLETLFYEGRGDEPTHYWPGDGDVGPFADPSGPSATAATLGFFRGHGL